MIKYTYEVKLRSRFVRRAESKSGIDRRDSHLNGSATEGRVTVVESRFNPSGQR